MNTRRHSLRQALGCGLLAALGLSAFGLSSAHAQGYPNRPVKLAMVKVQHWLESEKLKSLLVLQVHDELVLEVPDDELERIRTEVPRLMGSVAQLQVPLLVEAGVGDNWEEAH